jgi:hypothetical protein
VANYFFRSKHPTIPQLFWNTLYNRYVDINFCIDMLKKSGFRFDRAVFCEEGPLIEQTFGKLSGLALIVNCRPCSFNFIYEVT